MKRIGVLVMNAVYADAVGPAALISLLTTSSSSFATRRGLSMTGRCITELIFTLTLVDFRSEHVHEHTWTVAETIIHLREALSETLRSR